MYTYIYIYIKHIYIYIHTHYTQSSQDLVTADPTQLTAALPAGGPRALESAVARVRLGLGKSSCGTSLGINTDFVSVPHQMVFFGWHTS